MDNKQAQFSLKHGNDYPFNDRPAVDNAEKVVLGILADLTDRRGVRHELDACDKEVKEEMVTSLAAIVREVYGG